MASSLTGVVTSDKADKTIIINIVTRRTHPLYKKQYTFNTKYMAHDAKNDAKVGDLVVITEAKPLSKRKHYILTKILERGGIKFEETDAMADIPEDQRVETKESKIEETVPAKEPEAKK